MKNEVNFDEIHKYMKEYFVKKKLTTAEVLGALQSMTVLIAEKNGYSIKCFEEACDIMKEEFSNIRKNKDL